MAVNAEQFTNLSKQPIKEQLAIFLRAFAHEEDVNVRTAFLFANYFALTVKDGTEMDMSMATQFMQKLGYEMTVFELKAKLKEVDADSNGKLSTIEFLLMHFKKDVSLIFEDHDCDAQIIKDLTDAKAAVAANEETQQKLNAEEIESKKIAEAGGTKAFGANQRVEEIVKELDELNLGKGVGLKTLNKTLEKAVAAREAAPSAAEKLLEAEKLGDWDRHLQLELQALYSGLERDI